MSHTTDKLALCYYMFMIDKTKTKPKSKAHKPLTVKQKKFVAAKVSGATNYKAYQEAGYQVSARPTVEANASRLAKKDNIQAAIDNALNKVGATPEFAVNVLFEVAEQDKEIGARRLAAKDILELHGWNKSERPTTQLQINNSFFTESRHKIEGEVIEHE